MNRFLSKYLFYYPVTISRGEIVFKYLMQYKRMQWINNTDIEAYQFKKLNKLIKYAVANSSYYKQLMSDNGITISSINSLADLARVPATTKSDIVNYYTTILSTRKFLFSSSKTTGGSTGQPVTIKKNADALARERAATWRAYEWAGVGIGDIQARFWGVPLSKKSHLLSKLVDFVSNRTRLSAFQINEKSLEEYYKKLLKLRPAYLYGYVSMISAFAVYLEKNKLNGLPGLRSVITTSEVLDDHSRNLIENVFGVSVFNEYGCGEVGSIAHECEHGNMHVMAENVIIEIDASNSADGESGEIIVTELHNYAMPLIRYRLGDYATLSKEECKCGRGLPVLKKVHGRAYDMVIDPDGNRHHPEVLMYIFEELKSSGAGISQFQVIQISVDSFLINIVHDMSYKKETEEEILNRIREKIHPGFSVNFCYVDEIMREKSGKLRVIKSEINTY